jgi:LPXTG-site transpeptidase (sortase) family protein
VGNILIAVSILGLVLIYYPVAKEFLFPPHFTEQQKKSVGFSIEIPSIQVFSPVIEGVDPFDPKVYLDKLKDGVAQAKGTGLPGEKKTMYLFAHSSDVPWRITRYNTAFFKLDFVKNGDLVIVRKDGKEFGYKVFQKKTVWPSEVSYLKENQGDILILQTCTPVGTAFQRLLVFAKPI